MAAREKGRSRIGRNFKKKSPEEAAAAKEITRKKLSEIRRRQLAEQPPRKRPPAIAPDEYLLENYIPVPEAGCWIWLGGWNMSGYGRIGRHGKALPSAHRMFYTAHKGPIPKGLFVCHKCDTPACVNPDHLFVGTAMDNVQDMIRKGRGVAGRKRMNQQRQSA
jgi:hypothetical protein